MATLYVQNVPNDLYDALRKKAKEHGRSMAAEVLSTLREKIPTENELRARRALFKQAERLQAQRPLRTAGWISTEASLREDRSR